MSSETTYTQARANFAALCEQVTSSREPVVIRRRGREDVALVSAAELRSLEETAHLLSSPKNARRLVAALNRARSGKGRAISVDELRRQLDLQ
jgi:antitoxin YefM